MTRGPSFHQQPYDWVHFVAKQGEPGRRWSLAYRNEPGRSIRAWTRESLLSLQGGDFVRGKQPLELIAQELESCNGALSPSLRSVLDRWYFGARAYYFYLQAQYDQADKDLARAEMAIVQAIGLDPFLLPLAQEMADFPHQRIRIARSRRRWAEMERQIQIERRMMADRAPLCILADGRAIYFSTLECYYRNLPDLKPGERSYVDEFFDSELRLTAFERGVSALYALPGFVVACP